MPGERFIPIDDPFLLIAEAIDFFVVPCPNERLLIVADGGICSRDIIGIE
jgi:hypothetical protein